jgi:hypothetical protein
VGEAARLALGLAAQHHSSASTRIADVQIAAAQDVGPQSAAMRQRPQDAGAGEALEVRARLAAALAQHSTAPTRKRRPRRASRSTPAHDQCCAAPRRVRVHSSSTSAPPA